MGASESAGETKSISGTGEHRLEVHARIREGESRRPTAAALREKNETSATMESPSTLHFRVAELRSESAATCESRSVTGISMTSGTLEK